MFNGIEVDVLDIGDADCIIVTRWVDSVPHRVLIDGGCAGDAEKILEFLLQRGFTYFWAVVCTHLHNDHARGLIELVRNPSLKIENGWMHNINRHVSAEALRRASGVTDGVKEVIEATKELAAAFASRGITPIEPFTGMVVAGWPEMQVLGPSLTYYQNVMAEFTKVKVAMPLPLPVARPELSSLAALALATPATPYYKSLTAMLPPAPSKIAVPPLLLGALGNSSVKKNPTTQPFNNTSVILGVNFGAGLLLTGDAGTEALSHVGPEWNHLLYMGVPHHGSDGNLSQSDIERFCPKFAIISAKGDSSHPDRGIVSGLVKCGALVGSTHEHGNLWFHCGDVPPRSDYNTIEGLKGTGTPTPLIPRW